jgi:glutamine synthetase
MTNQFIPIRHARQLCCRNPRPNLRRNAMTLGDAIAQFERSDLMKKAFPAELRDIFIELKKDEWARYCGVITEWEFAQYWETLP